MSRYDSGYVTFKRETSKEISGRFESDNEPMETDELMEIDNWSDFDSDESTRYYTSSESEDIDYKLPTNLAAGTVCKTLNLLKVRMVRIVCFTKKPYNIPNAHYHPIFTLIYSSFLKEFHVLNEKLVAKEWLLTADSNEMEELCLNLNEEELLNWTYTGDPVVNIVNFSHPMLCTKEKTSLDLFRYVRWSSLKRLMINAPVNYARFKLSRVNCFRNLEHLEVSCYTGCNDYLELPNLLILRIDVSFACNLMANLPQLRLLETNIGLSQLWLKHPDSIRHLHIHCISEGMQKFKHLKGLSIRYVTIPFEHLIEQLPSLMKVEFDPVISPNVVKRSFLNILQALLDEKHRLNRRTLSFHLNRKAIYSVEHVCNNESYKLVEDLREECEEGDESSSI